MALSVILESLPIINKLLKQTQQKQENGKSEKEEERDRNPKKQTRQQQILQQQQQWIDVAPRKGETSLAMAMPSEASMGESEVETEVDQITSYSKVKHLTTIW